MRATLRLNLRHDLYLMRPAVALVALALATAACANTDGTATPSAVPAAPSTAPASAAAGGPTPVDSGPPLAVLGTENFYADLLTQIGGSRVASTSLINDPNADPHAFESSPQSAATVADAKLVIVNGLGYDDFMQKLMGASPNPARAVIDVQQLLGLADDANVHVWYDPATMPKVAAAATEALSKLEPANAAYFAANEQAYLAALQPINDKIAQLKAAYPGAPIAFTENVAGYLTDQIGLDLKSPVGFMKAVEEGTDPAPGRCRRRARPVHEQGGQGARLQQPGHLAHDRRDPRPRDAERHPDRRRRGDDPADVPHLPGVAARPALRARAGAGQGAVIG